MDIDDSEIGFATFAALLFIQSQHASLLTDLLSQPPLRTRSGLLHDGRNRSQTHVLVQQNGQARLNASIAGVSFHQ